MVKILNALIRGKVEYGNFIVKREVSGDYNWAVYPKNEPEYAMRVRALWEAIRLARGKRTPWIALRAFIEYKRTKYHVPEEGKRSDAKFALCGRRLGISFLGREHFMTHGVEHWTYATCRKCKRLASKKESKLCGTM